MRVIARAIQGGGRLPPKNLCILWMQHDDNTDAASAKLVRDITDRHKNPNGCKINAAFYTTSSLSTCAAVMSLYKE